MSQRDNPAYKKFDLIKLDHSPTVRIRGIDHKILLTLFVLTLLPLFKVIFPFWTYFDGGPFEKVDVIQEIPSKIKFLNEPRLPNSVDVLVMVNSQVEEAHLRVNVRASWANSTVYDPEITKVIFVLGRPSSKEESRLLDQEIKEHHDLLILDVEEDYYSLSLKTYAMLYYKSKKLPKTKCLVKADSDNVLHLFNYEILCEETKAPVVLGRCDVERRVKRKNSKWAVPFELYEPAFWPRYCSTGTYVFCGKDVPKKIILAAKQTKFFTSTNYRRLPEDVLFTGIFAELAGIRRKHIGGMSFRDQPEYACRDVKNTYSIHMHRRKNPIYYYKKLISLSGGTCLL